MIPCRFCFKECIRKGWQSGRQKLFCKTCNKYQQLTYSDRKINPSHEKMVVLLNNEGCSVSSMGRITGFSKTSICNVVDRLGLSTRIEFPKEQGCEYEVDELRTFVGNKKNECWIIYALNKLTKKIAALTVGGRTKENIRKVTDVLLRLNPERIFTDKLLTYDYVIPENLHENKKRSTNHIERKNLHLRQQLRRLQRKTICYSKSERMLKNSLMLFLSGQVN